MKCIGKFTITITALVGLLLAGCTLGPDYKRPIVSVPVDWRTPAPTIDSLANVAWWQFYRDPVLTNLIGLALTNNHDVRIAAARVEQALGGYHAQRSALWPSVDAAGNWTRARSGYTGITGNTFDVFGLLSYEVDIFGRNRRFTESARAQWLASEEGQRAIYLSLIGNVAATYFNLRTLDSQLAVARQTLASRTNSLELVRIKYNEVAGLGQGIVSELDVKQAETQVHAARSSIASLERAVAVTENALSFLIGRHPGAVDRGRPLASQFELGVIPAGLPSDLLLRRPDLRASEQQLIAANANIGAARAAYFPTLSLTAALGSQSVALDDLFSGANRAWRFAPQVTTPIFNAGRIRAGVRTAEARQREALAAYEQAIQNAFREVNDGLVSVAKLREQLAADEDAVQAERKRLELSRLRYEGGVASYSDVLDAERFLFNAELQSVQTRGDLLTACAQLYKSLGGGWSHSTVRPL
jgi:outer membrane protein, multidrug efflux system